MSRDRDATGEPTGGSDAGGYDVGVWGSALIRAVGTLDGASRRGSTGPLRSWVIGWTHRFDARARGGTGVGGTGAGTGGIGAGAGTRTGRGVGGTGAGTGTGGIGAGAGTRTGRGVGGAGIGIGTGVGGIGGAADYAASGTDIHAVGDLGAIAAPVAHSHARAGDPLGPYRAGSAPFEQAGEQTPPPAVVRRLVEAVVDVLLERRSAEQVRRWVSREVFGLLSTVAQRRASIRFASRSTVRSIRMHIPALDAVESTVLVQDGPRVRAVALRFERSALPTAAHSTCEPDRCEPVRHDADRLEWRCTALQFA